MTTPSLPELRRRIAAVMARDQRRLRGKLKAAKDLPGLLRELEAAEARVASRRAQLPRPQFPAELPVSQRREEIRRAIEANQVVIVAGETGSGKSTQLPKICLSLGRGVRGFIGHTQPRRIAARAVAERVAEEIGSTVGGKVGYTVRFTDRVGENTFVKVMTDGILLAELQRDRTLSAYDTLIIDEAHERSLNIDFILGYLKQLLPRRPDLKVIVTSATIDVERFSAHFDGAPVIEVSGRTYPVEIRHRPIDEESDQAQAIGMAVEELWTEGPGDILVFLSGEREIRDTADALVEMKLPDTEIVPLYARLTAAEQHRVFEPHASRRVVLATNVAETSLTVPGIRYVIDPGTARISRYSHRTKVQRLPIESISQASANQRAGRCGRIGPGVCIRLYSADDFETRTPFTEPEIVRTNLASVVLQMSSLGLGDIAAFPFVEAPDVRNIRDGVDLLDELGALKRGELTPIGRKLAQLPVDPRLARMIVEAGEQGSVREVMIIAGALSIQDPRERPAEMRKAADEMHSRFNTESSDFLAYLRLWTYVQSKQKQLSGSKFRKLCKAEFLNWLRVREWQDIYHQLVDVGRGIGLRPQDKPAGDKQIHIALLAGLLSHIGMREGTKFDYLGARGARFAISPGSGLFKAAPRWVMAGELVETTRLWGHDVARIQPEWAERLAGDLAKRTHGEPRWDPSRVSAVVDEKVSLYGIPIVAGRKLDLGRVDVPLAREWFIRHALVLGDWETSHAFLRANREMVDEVRSMEDRTRRRDILVGDDALFDFYASRIPEDVTCGREFDKWFRASNADLEFTAEMLVRATAGRASPDDFPDVWRHGGIELRVTYQFEPGADDDGATIHVPVAVLNQLTPEGFDWHVPGMRAELVAELIRTLPKTVRRPYMPFTVWASRFLESVSDAGTVSLPGAKPSVTSGRDTRLIDALAEFLGVSQDEFDLERVPPHLRLRFLVTDERDRVVASGHDLTALQAPLQARMRQAIVQAVKAGEQSGLTSFVPIDRVVERSGVKGYPAFTDDGESVSLRVYATEAEQARAMRAGTRRLLLIAASQSVRSVQRLLDNDTKITLGPEALDDCISAAIDAVATEPAWDPAAFEELVVKARAQLPSVAAEIATKAARVLSSSRTLDRRLQRLTNPKFADATTDMREQLTRLTGGRFVTRAGESRLDDLLRYVRAIDHRLDKLAESASRDAVTMERVRGLEEEYRELRAELGPAATRDVRWMLEELRVGLFAQHLGTAYKVSETRVERELDRLHGR